MRYIFTNLEEYVEKLYQHLSINVPSEINMMDIAKQLDISLHFSSVGSQIIERNNLFFMILNSSLSSQQQWQDFGHELCHALKHCGNQLRLPPNFISLQENQANNFMYHFCVPSFMLLQLEISNYSNIKDGISFVSSTFNVTEEFAYKRLIMLRNQFQQAQMDAGHRRFMEALYPKAPPYSDETNVILTKLHKQIAAKEKGSVQANV